MRSTALRAAIGSLAIGQSIAVVATLGTTAVLARAMPRDDFGAFITAWTFVTLAGSLIKLGMSSSLQREIPLRHGAGDNRGAVSLVLASRRLLRLTWVLSFPVVAVLATVLVPQLQLVSLATLLVLVATGSEASRGVGETVLRGFGLPSQSQQTGNPLRSTILLGLAVAMWLNGGGWNLTEALAALVVANVVCVVLQGLQTRRLVVEKEHDDVAPRVRHLARLAPRFVLIDASAILLSQGDVLVAAQVLDPGDLAIYAIAVRLAVFLLMPAMVIGTAVAPQISYYTGQRDRPRLSNVVRRASVLATGVTLAGAVAFALVGRPTLRIAFGESFTGAYEIVLILAVGAVLNAAPQLSGWLLICLGRESETFVVMASVTVAQLVACYAFGMAFGLTGIAWASAVGTFAQSGLLAVLYLRNPSRRLDDEVDVR